eukprot:SAG31_NODE_153_length_22196_cov_24.963570_4_plen_380_part_00
MLVAISTICVAMGASISGSSASAAERPSSTLRDYGYYYGMGGAVSPATHHMDNLPRFADHSTCAFLTDAGSASDLAGTHVAQLTELAEHNMTGVLPITGVFWHNATSLHANWSRNWEDYWATIVPHASSISAFYPLDEPSPEAIASGLYGQTVRAIKRSASSIPIAAVITQSAVKGIEYNEYDLPKEVDMIGFDAYGCWAEHECEQHGRCCWQNRTVPHNLGVLKEYAQKRPVRSQDCFLLFSGACAPTFLRHKSTGPVFWTARTQGAKLLVVGDGLGSSKPGPLPIPPTAAQQAAVSAIDRQFFDWCEAEVLCTTMWIFLWSSIRLPTGGWLVGVDEQHTVLQPALVKLGTIIKNRGREHPAPAQAALASAVSGCEES